MLSRRTRLRLSFTLLALALLTAASYVGGRYLLRSNGVERLDWQGLALSGAGMHVGHLALRQRSAAGLLELQGDDLQLAWRDFGVRLPLWQHLTIERLALNWQPQASAEPQPDQTPLDLQQLAAPLALLPRGLEIAELQATLPCARGQCSASGSLALQRQPDDQVSLRLNIDHQQRQIAATLDVQPSAEGAALQLGIAVDGQAQIELSSHLQENGQGLNWSGQLDARQLSQAAVLQDWLSGWALPDGAQWPAAPGEVDLQGTWRLSLPGRDLQLKSLLAAQGAFDLQGELPQPWPVPSLGLLQGSLALAATNDSGQWIAEKLAADLLLTQPTGDWLQKLPAELRSDSLRVSLKPDTPMANLRAPLQQRSLPLLLAIELRGASRLDLQGHVALASAAPWSVQWSQTRLSSQTASMNQAGWQARNLQSELRLAGHADANGVELSVDKGSQLKAASLRGTDVQAQQAQVNLSGSTFNATLQDGAVKAWQFAGPLALSTAQLQQANLKPLGWRWQGQVTASDQGTSATGRLSNDSDLQLDLTGQLDAGRNLQLTATLSELFLRSGNPLAKTLAQWPDLLDLNDGRLNASAKLSLAAGRTPPDVDLNLATQGVSGIYDRTELNGLDSRLQLRLARQRFDLDLQQVKLQQANPGLPIGPVELQGRYGAPLTNAAKGQLQLSQAQTALMGGQVILPPGQWDLARGNQLFPLQLRGLELQQLFALYPAQGLSGTGTLDGDLPLRLGSDGIEVANGKIAARQPGGRLRFNSEKIRALGRSNPAMQLVTQSLEDFNFTTLSSSVDYDQHGKLALGMRLEGQNPAIEKGRPIHFNINLEEDIPKLLTSLQLTDRVNDIITRRVQQRVLQQRNAAPNEP